MLDDNNKTQSRARAYSRNVKQVINPSCTSL